MTVWVIEPRDPLIFRDGRSFDAVPGTRAISLSFPFPSTTAGAIRTREGQDSEGRFQRKEIPRVNKIAVCGPLLVEIDDKTGDIERWLVHAPRDALLMERDVPEGTKAILKKLVPLQTASDVHTDLPKGLSIAGMARPDLSKPSKKAPRFWYWETFEKWLTQPEEQEVVLKGMGHSGPVRETRFHVGIDPETRAADKNRGSLFQTRGLEFAVSSEEPGLSKARRLGLAVATVATEAPGLRDGLGFLGGERRLVTWRKSEMSLPVCPDLLRSRIVRDRHCRVVLLTPAHFELGWKPTWLLASAEGVTPKLRAMAIGRPQVVSGWDLDKGGAKPARRLAAAGTVLFLELAGNDDAIGRWVNKIWMSPISDGKQDRLDGFGLAALGTWDGSFRRMEV